MARKIILGRRYRDKIHGIEGVATSITSYLEGCDRVCLERVLEDHSIIENWFDAPRLTLLPSKKIRVKGDEAGGVRDSAPKRDPVR